jgi:hypothetical protein
MIAVVAESDVISVLYQGIDQKIVQRRFGSQRSTNLRGMRWELQGISTGLSMMHYLLYILIVHPVGKAHLSDRRSRLRTRLSRMAHPDWTNLQMYSDRQEPGRNIAMS